MLDLPINRWIVLIPLIAAAFLAGLILDRLAGTAIDDWIHDSALVFQAREEWRYTAVVVLDHGVPIDVGRKQALPLFAKATERIIAAGGKGVFLDAVVSKEMEGRMPYAACIEPIGAVQWSQPRCAASPTGECRMSNSELGNAPLQMPAFAIEHFKIAPYFSGQEALPDFLLYGLEAAFAVPENGLVASDRLVSKKNSPIARWLDLSPDHAVVALTRFILPQNTGDDYLHGPDDELCDGRRPCRRIRLSKPQFVISEEGNRPMIPVSRLASCDSEIAERTAALLRDKVAVFQLTAPDEATDVLVTPMTTGLLGPHLPTHGAQFLADAVETLLNRDHPRAPALPVKAALFLIAALIGVLSGAYLKQSFVWLIGGLFITAVGSLCYLNDLVQLWPVTTSMIVFIAGVGQTIGMHLIIGSREGKLIINYMPRQIHNLLISLKPNETFQNRRRFALVLMSDLAGYTTVTGFIKDPAEVLNLMNDYLSETSLILQDKYNGWLEDYVGDMVCYYWPYQCNEGENIAACANALQAALELVTLQKRFFATLEERYDRKIEADVIKRIHAIIDAGVGLTAGSVVMGDLGPKKGVRKFGILGDPMNLAARVESLTRLFNTEIIVTEDFIGAARQLNYPVRRLGRLQVKGRNEPATLYAVGHAGDSRFSPDAIAAWENWLAGIETHSSATSECPEVYRKDRSTITKWLERRLLGADGVWHLDEK
ncbi:adenylate/guanylate cyclase domain-containing protein [Methylotuvimicrobium alcaliphilum]|uniref:Adenylate cyclase n=1 Tax=Methylotuvimicrobium alcaliphilum (strain DSM 19304 / NCIMB 14124 / VKM B-2133 / 20Z) TaxID=1091494 RepID=G4STS9_META2|nr:adenylate/guanylate cyclase domain-containing protein [Methylotuvimicrobium alcaliphilum]CCE21751.1 putative adenylate cyclase [Methylotuvimicrobium alcaliphilum 20Z]